MTQTRFMQITQLQRYTSTHWVVLRIYLIQHWSEGEPLTSQEERPVEKNPVPKGQETTYKTWDMKTALQQDGGAQWSP